MANKDKPRLSKNEVRVLTNSANTLYMLIRDKAVDKKTAEILYGMRAAIRRILIDHGIKSLSDRLQEDRYLKRNQWPDSHAEKWESLK